MIVKMLYLYKVKGILISVMLVSVLGCNTSKSSSEKAILEPTVSYCPDDGTCSFEVLENKIFSIMADEFGNNYSKLVDGNKTILKFTYTKNKIPDVADGDYSEIIYIEIEHNTSSLKLEDEGLKSVKAGFSRACFCRGQTGTFPVKIGSLSITKLKSSFYEINFDFTITQVPQIIKSINETFKLKKATKI
tara:strand:+ start:1142 stop:1711 length:570 start_codon:yes stop_codon:yes gene_type:complete